MRAGLIVAALSLGCSGNSNTSTPAPEVPVATANNSTEVHCTRNDIQALLTGAGGTDLRVVEKDGKIIGMRLVGAGAGTTAAKLGAANDDVIYSIGGHPLDSIGNAYRAGDLVAGEPRIEIKASRNGAPYTLVLVVDK